MASYLAYLLYHGPCFAARIEAKAGVETVKRRGKPCQEATGCLAVSSTPELPHAPLRSFRQTASLCPGRARCSSFQCKPSVFFREYCELRDHSLPYSDAL